MASLVAGLFLNPSERVGRGVAEHFCCSQRRPSPPSELHVAKLLMTKVQCYCEAVEGRRKSLAAVDGFYRELMVCQWRIEAIEAQQRALQEPEVPEKQVVSPTAFEAVSWEGQTDGFNPVETCLAELATLHDAALQGLEERAAHYAVTNWRSNGLPKRVISSEDKSTALERYRKLAEEVFAEAAAEMRGLTEAPKAAWANLPNSLARRLKFWSCELEETWSNWQDATSRMYSAGHDALGAWRDIAEVLECACQHFEHLQDGGQKVIAKPELQAALIIFVARSLEVELLNSLGLSGLRDADADDDGEPQLSFCVEMRLDMLTSVLELLCHLNVLDRVGEELLHAGGSLPSSQVAAWLAENVSQVSSDVNDLHSLASGELSARVLLPWFIECLLQAVASAARREEAKESEAVALPFGSFGLWKAALDGPSMSTLLDRCGQLAGVELAEALKALALQRSSQVQRRDPKKLKELTKELSSSCTRLLDLDCDQFDTPVFGLSGDLTDP